MCYTANSQRQSMGVNHRKTKFKKQRKKTHSLLRTVTGFFDESPRRFQRPMGLLFFVTGGGGQKAKGEAFITVSGSMKGAESKPAARSVEEDSIFSSARGLFLGGAASSEEPSSSASSRGWLVSTAASSSSSSPLEAAVATDGSSSWSTSTARWPAGDSGQGG